MADNVCGKCGRPRSEHTGIGEACPEAGAPKETREVCGQCGRPRTEHKGRGERCP